MIDKILLFCRKTGTPLAKLEKNVLVNEEEMEDIVDFLGSGECSEAPCFLPLFGDFTVVDARESFRKASEEILGARTKTDFSGENVFLNARPAKTKELLEKILKLGPERIVVICRETVAAELVAEPGFPKYSAFSVFANTFYDVEAFRLPSQLFYPPAPSPLAEALFKKKKSPIPQFFDFLEKLFVHKSKSVSKALRIMGFSGGMKKKVDQCEPEELLELFLSLPSKD